MFKTLAKIGPVTKAFSFVTGNFRLVIEYALIAVIISMAGVTLTLWLSKAEVQNRLHKTETQLATVSGRLQMVETVNNMQSATIDDLKELRVRDSDIVERLMNGYDTLLQKDRRVRNRLSKLETTNEAVKEYLNQPVPPELGCLLNDSPCSGNQDSNQDRAPDPARRITPTLPAPN